MSSLAFRPSLLLALVALGVSAPAPAAAGDEPDVTLEAPPDREGEGPLEPQRMSLVLGAFGGAALLSPDHELYDSTQSFQAPYSDVAAKLGLRLGWFPLTFVGVEGEGGYVPVSNARGEQNHVFDGRAHAVVQLPGRVTPFALAGGGFLGVAGERGGDVDGALHWGGGVKVYATPWMNVRADARHVISGAAGPGAGNTDHFEVSLGVGFVLFREPSGEATVVMPPEPSEVRVTEGAPETEGAPAPEPEVEAEGEAEVQPEPDAEPEPEVVVIERELYVEALDPVRFAFDSAGVPASFLPVLREVVALMQARPELDAVIVGHADSTGPAAYNLLLSKRRAEAVAQFLVERGVLRARIRARGEGEELPAAPNDTPTGRARNRRTEITVVERRERPGALDASIRAPHPAPGPR